MNKKSLLIGAIVGGLIMCCAGVVLILGVNYLSDTQDEILSVIQEPVVAPALEPTSTPEVTQNYIDEALRGMLLIREGLGDMQSQTSLVTPNSLIWLDEDWKTKVRDAIDKQAEGMEIISSLVPPANAIPMHMKLLQSFVELKLAHELLIDGIEGNDPASIGKAPQHIGEFSRIFVEAADLVPRE